MLKPASGVAGSLALQAVGIKLYALVLGTAGIGTLGIVRQVVSLGTSAATLNSQTVLIQGFSRAEARRRFAATAAAIMLAATIAVGVLIAVASPMIASKAFPSEHGGAALAIAATVLPVAAGAGFLFISSLLIAVDRLGSAALAQVCGATVFALVAYPAAAAARNGSAMAYLGSFAFGALASAAAAFILLGPDLRRELAHALVLRHLDRGEARRYMGLSLAVFAAGAINAVTLLVVRLLLADQHGLSAAGLFEAAWSSSALSLAVGTGALTASQLPIMSRAKDAQELRRATDDAVTSAIVFAVPGLVILVAAKPLFTRLLFNAEFLPMLETWRWMLMGDLLRIVGWALMLPLLAKRRAGAYLILEVFASCVLIAGFALALANPHFRDGLGAAYLAMTAAYACCAFALLTYSGGPPLSRETSERLLFGACLVGGLSLHLWDATQTSVSDLVLAVVLCAAYLAAWRWSGQRR